MQTYRLQLNPAITKIRHPSFLNHEMMCAIRQISSNNLFTLSLPQPVKFPGLKVHTYTPATSISDGPITGLLPILCILVETLSRVHVKGQTSLNDFKFGTLLVAFRSTARQPWQ